MLKCSFGERSNNKKLIWLRKKDGIITGFEFKWKAKSNLKLPTTFVNEYNAKEVIIDRNNFRDFTVVAD